MDVTLEQLVVDEYARLHDALAGLPDDAWSQPSLCAGWSLAHVLAHLTTPARYSPEAFGTELAAVGYDFTALNNRIADRDSSLPTAELLAALRDERLARFTTPEGGFPGALSHVVIHGLDMTVPAGLGCVASDDAVEASLELMTGGVHQHFGTSLDVLDADPGAPAHVRLLRLTGRDL